MFERFSDRHHSEQRVTNHRFGRVFVPDVILHVEFLFTKFTAIRAFEPWRLTAVVLVMRCDGAFRRVTFATPGAREPWFHILFLRVFTIQPLRYFARPKLWKTNQTSFELISRINILLDMWKFFFKTVAHWWHNICNRISYESVTYI